MDLGVSRAGAPWWRGLPPLGRQVVSLLVPTASWVTFLLLFLTLLVVSLSVEAAQWVTAPSLVALTFLGLATGALLSRWRLLGRWRLHGLLLQVVALPVGIATVVALVSSLVEPPEGQARLVEMVSRLQAWAEAAFGGGISSDTLPFALMLAAGAWLIGYLSGWFTFRMQNVWGAILPGALGLLTNLSYLPPRFFSYFFLYIVAAMLLVVWMHGLRRAEGWPRGALAGFWQGSLLSLFNALVLGLIIVVVAAALPLNAVVAEPIRRAYAQVHSPIEGVQGHFNRVFSGLPSRKDGGGLEGFGSALPFQGLVPRGEGVVFTAHSPYLTYWTAQAYDTYTPQGWPAALVEARPWDWKPLGSEPTVYRSRLEVPQEVALNVATDTVFHAGLPEVLSPLADLLVPQVPVYTIDLQGTSILASLPPDLREWAQGLQQAWAANRDDGAFRQALTGLLLDRLPRDTVLVSADVRSSRLRSRHLSLQEAAPAEGAPVLGPVERILRTDGRLTSLTVTRAQPSPPDLLALQSPRLMAPGTGYTVEGSISIASEAQLLGAGTTYPRWVTDRYLKLPNSVTPRTRQTAAEVTRGVQTPYEKALAIENYLRQFEYSESVAPPPYNADGVDYFLFTQRKGHSDYFASAMTVLLRAVEVPTRLVAGYGTGTWDPVAQVIVVRERDRHTWPEAFFPGYGWVVFEPTPIYASPQRGLPTPIEAGGTAPAPESDFPCEGLDPVACEELLAQPVAEDVALEASAPAVPLGAQLLRGGLVGSVVVIGLVLVGYLIWQRGTRALGDPQRAYEQMRLLAGLAHLGPQLSQTPYEFGHELAARLPSVGRHVEFICDTYVRTTYGRQTIPRQEQVMLDESWRRVRGRVLRRVIHLGGS